MYPVSSVSSRQTYVLCACKTAILVYAGTERRGQSAETPAQCQRQGKKLCKEKQAAELKKAEKRKAEVDGLFAKMYEDWSAGQHIEVILGYASPLWRASMTALSTSS